MKLAEIIMEIDGAGSASNGIPAYGPLASRSTPTAALSHWGIVNSKLPHQFAKDRVWAEEKEKKKKKRKKLRDLESRIDNARPRPY
jgi:hypothetical protein